MIHSNAGKVSVVTLTALFILLILLLVQTTAQAACTKDTDCKGDRVCEYGQCVAPHSVQRTPDREQGREREGFRDHHRHGLVEWLAVENARPTGTFIAGQISDAGDSGRCGVCRANDHGNLHVGKLCNYNGRWSCFIGNGAVEQRYEQYEAMIASPADLQWERLTNSLPFDPVIGGQISDAGDSGRCGVCRANDRGNLHVGKLCNYDGRWSCFIGNSGVAQRYETYEALGITSGRN